MRTSYDNKYLVTGSSDRLVKVFQVNVETCIVVEHLTLFGHSAWVWDLRILANSAIVISCSSDGTIKCWDLKDGKLVKECANEKRENETGTRKNRFTCLATNT